MDMFPDCHLAKRTGYPYTNEMEDAYLYQQIASSVRKHILDGKLKPGDRLPSLRESSSQWNCTVATVQRAYRELAQQGLVTSRAGQGTRVVKSLPTQDQATLRRAALVHRAETFLLEVFTAGHSPIEVEDAVREALDHWRTFVEVSTAPPPKTIRFSGSHDLIITWLGSYFPEIINGFHLNIEFPGSLGGLIALASGNVEIAGCHLWDQESDTYNIPFIRRLLPGQKLAVQTLAGRHLGLILPKGNPHQIEELTDLVRPGIRFANRQAGSGSRVWLDAKLQALGINRDQIIGYLDERTTHLEIAKAVAEGEISVGVGLEAAANSYGLDFVPLALEQYDLVIPQRSMENPGIVLFMDWLTDPIAKRRISSFPGYETNRTGNITWMT